MTDEKNILGENIARLRSRKGWTQQHLADALGVNRGAVAQYEAGNNKPKLPTLEKLAEIFNVDLKKLQTKPLNNISNKKEETGTPIYDMHATAGGNDNVSQLPEVPSFHVNVPGYEDCNFGMYVYGHSMYPTIETGSLVLCRRVRDKSVIMYGEIYLIRTDDYLMVKRLQKAKAGTVLCTSDNFEKRSPEFKRFEPFELDIDKIIDLYLVKGIIKKTQS